MTTKESTARGDEKLHVSPDIQHEAITMALAILVDRIRGLPRDDREDLFELVKELPAAQDCEEVESIVLAMREILEQAPIKVRALGQTSNDEPGEQLTKWITFVRGRIKALRKEKGLTQEQLAQRSGLPQSHISKLENGKHSPSALTLEKIASALGVPSSELDPSA
ncbi:MAG TPA: helix-turn-helix transcriptional regulator [Pirellulales bacterium]|nr:helix-turn-helix transcriptional regulator [Pirellulales bacterium]